MFWFTYNTSFHSRITTTENDKWEGKRREGKKEEREEMRGKKGDEKGGREIL